MQADARIVGDLPRASVAQLAEAAPRALRLDGQKVLDVVEIERLDRMLSACRVVGKVGLPIDLAKLTAAKWRDGATHVDGDHLLLSPLEDVVAARVGRGHDLLHAVLHTGLVAVVWAGVRVLEADREQGTRLLAKPHELAPVGRAAHDG